MSYYKMNTSAIEADLYVKINVLCQAITSANLGGEELREQLTKIFNKINPAYGDALEYFGDGDFFKFISEYAGTKGKLTLAEEGELAAFDDAGRMIGKLYGKITGQVADEDANVIDMGVLVDDDGVIIDEEDADSLMVAYSLLLTHMAQDLANGGERIRMVTYWDAQEIDTEFAQLVRGFFGEDHPINDVEISKALALAVAHPSEEIYELFDEPIQKLAYAYQRMEEVGELLVYQGNGYTISLDPTKALMATDHASGDMYEAINFIEVEEDGEE